MTNLRTRIFAELRAAGFRVAESLPQPDVHQQMRPIAEIASRLMALDALVTWVALTEKLASSARINSYIERNQLRSRLTAEEIEIVNLARADAREEHLNTIGWRLENMWPLAWVLGFPPTPNLEASQIPDEIIRAMMYEFLPGLDASLDTLLAKSSPRSLDAVAEMEYRFYCAHNAVRSAQLGGDTVPPEFDPLAHGGAIHERRHSLTWCLAPGVDWDDTDLST